MTTLGHIQRGGSPTAHDRVLATRYGLKAAELVRDRAWGQMAALHGDEIVAVPIADAVAELKTGARRALRAGQRASSGRFLRAMGQVTTTDIDALWGPATPQFAYQIAERLEALIADLPPGDPVRRHGELRLAELDQLGHDTSKGNEAGH